MAKPLTKSSEKKDTQSRKMHDLPAKTLGAGKAALVKGGGKAKGTQQEEVEFLKVTLTNVN